MSIIVIQLHKSNRLTRNDDGEELHIFNDLYFWQARYT